MAIKHRRNTAITALFLYFATIPFLIVVLIGNTHINGVLNDFYFFKLDVSHIIPISVANHELLNSVARSLGLHDFYSVGLWNFCEGYIGQGVTFCSKPRQFFWFNPVEVLVSELLAGAKIALPSQVLTILKLLKIGSQVMYGFFMSGTVVNFLLIFASPLVIRTRWFTLLLTFFGAIAGVLLTVAAIIATVISVAAKVALTAQDQLNLSADLGIKMLAFMWTAALLTDLAFILHSALACCCKPQRSSGSLKSFPSMQQTTRPNSLPSFVRRRRG